MSTGSVIGGHIASVESYRMLGIFDDCLSDICIETLMPWYSIALTNSADIITRARVRASPGPDAFASHGSDHAS